MKAKREKQGSAGVSPAAGPCTGKMPALRLNKGSVPTRSKAVASVRIWQRNQRSDLWYCTLRLPDRKPIVRSCRRRIRASAEQFAQLLFTQLSKPAARLKPSASSPVQLELPPP